MVAALERLRRGAGLDALVTGELQRRHDESPDAAIVVDDEDPRAGGRMELGWLQGGH
jgi:hypothetical protein